MPHDRIGIGIIGLGAQGNAHLRALLACPEAEVMALCDPDAEALRLAELSARQGWAQPQLLSDYR
ncbi:MAG: gfo/Idh/MocA family oxidoreductase, partial [Dehalococcoidia bacterium]